MKYNIDFFRTVFQTDLRYNKDFTDEMKTYINQSVPNIKSNSFTQKLFWIINSLSDYPKCRNINCSKLVTKWNRATKKYSLYCGSKCANSCEQVKSKKIDKALKTFGTKNPLCSPIVKEKIRKTNIRKYGVVTPLQNKEIKKSVMLLSCFRNAIKRICSHNVKQEINIGYINTNFGSMEEYRKFTKKQGVKKRTETLLEKYGVRSPKHIGKNSNSLRLLSDETYFLEQTKIYSLKDIARVFKLDYSTVSGIASKLGLVSKWESYGELELRSLLDSCNEQYETNTKKYIWPYELDIYLPEKKLAIEFNGNYWHSEANTKRDKMYHMMKFNKCENQGIVLLQIHEDELFYKKEIVMSKIKNILGLSKKYYAKNLAICELTSKDKNVFLEDNHLQGLDCSKVNLGLKYKDELLSVMTFSKPRFNKNYDWELTRFCVKKYCAVIGGFSRLLKYFIKTYKPATIISYSDNRYGTGNVYKTNGFMLLHETPPNYSYIKNNDIHRYNRMRFQKKRLKRLKDFNFDDSLTEHENMLANNYLRVYDAGQRVWIFDTKIEKVLSTPDNINISEKAEEICEACQ